MKLPLSTLISGLIFISTVCMADPDIPRVSVESDHIIVLEELDRLIANGNLRLRVGDLELGGQSLTLDLKKETLRVELPRILGLLDGPIQAASLKIELGAGRLELDRPRFRLSFSSQRDWTIDATSAVCTEDTCVVHGLEGTACPHHPQGVKIVARRLKIHPNGDVDLSEPRVKVADKTIIAVPWIRLRHPLASGFLPPRIGFTESAGFILGPAGAISLSKNAGMEGHFALRTASGLEASAKLHTPTTSMRIDHLLDHGENHARVQSKGLYLWEGATFSTNLDITSNRRVIDETTFDPLERSRTHTISRALLSTGNDFVAVESYFELLAPFTKERIVGRHRFVPAAVIEVAMPSSPISFLWPEWSARFSRRGAVDPEAMGDVLDNVAPGHSKLDIQYGLSIPKRFGPFEFEPRAKMRHIAWLIDQSEYGAATHLAAIAADIHLPLARQFHTFRHRIDPFIRYRLTPFKIGPSPPFISDDTDRLRTGQGLEVGFSTRLAPKTGDSVARLRVFERFDLPGFDWRGGPAYLYASTSFGNEFLFGAMDGAYDQREHGLSLGGFSITGFSKNRSQMTLGGRWIGKGLGPHLDSPFRSASGPFLFTRTPHTEGGHAEIFEDLRFSLTERFSVLMHTRMGVWPVARFHVMQYGFEIGSPCSCLVMGVLASHRPSTRFPDIMATINMPHL